MNHNLLCRDGFLQADVVEKFQNKIESVSKVGENVKKSSKNW